MSTTGTVLMSPAKSMILLDVARNFRLTAHSVACLRLPHLIPDLHDVARPLVREILSCQRVQHGLHPVTLQHKQRLSEPHRQLHPRGKTCVGRGDYFQRPARVLRKYQRKSISNKDQLSLLYLALCTALLRTTNQHSTKPPTATLELRQLCSSCPTLDHRTRL